MGCQWRCPPVAAVFTSLIGWRLIALSPILVVKEQLRLPRLPGECQLVGTRNSPVMPPAGLIRPILLANCSVNQRLPSGPDVMPKGPLPDVGTENSMMPE